MQMTQLILRFLGETGRAALPNFGLLTLESLPARMDEESRRMLPPGQKIVFEYQPEVSDEGLTRYLAQEMQMSADAVSEALTAQTNDWLARLHRGETVAIAGLGRFQRVGEQIILQGEILNDVNPQHYGLSDLKMEELGLNAPMVPRSMKWLVLTVLLILLVLLGLLYWASKEGMLGVHALQKVQNL